MKVGFRVFYLFVAVTLISYLVGYFAYFGDRSIFSWIYLIHYLSPQLLVLFVVVSSLVAYWVSGVELQERYYLPVLILVSLACSSPFFSLPQFNPDSIMYFTAARFIQEKGFLQGLSELPSTGVDFLPGYPMLLSVILLFGKGYPATQIMHVLFYVMVPILVYMIGSTLWDTRIGFYGGLLSLSTPIVLSNHYFMLIDLPLTVFVLVFVYSGLKSMKNICWAILAFLSVLSALTFKIGGLLFIAALFIPLLVLFLWDRINRGNVIRMISVSVFLLVMVVGVIYSLPSLQKRISDQVYILDVKSNILRFFQVANSDPTSGLPFVIGFPQFILFAAYIILSLRSRDRRNILLYAWIVLPFIVAHDTKARYLMPMFPAISLCAALAVRWLGDLRLQGVVIYFACFVMVSVTVFAVPLVAPDYVFKNLQVEALQTNDLSIGTVGVYSYQDPLIYNPHKFAPAVDIFSSKKVMFLGFNDYLGYYTHNESWAIGRRLLSSVYPSMNLTPNQVDSILKENYSLYSESKGGILKYYNTYFAKLYLKKSGMGGPTDAILYLSNIDAQDDELSNKSSVCSSYTYSLYCRSKRTSYPQSYSLGPLRLGATYGIDFDSWLGENMLFMKPPNVGQINQTYNLFIPENSTLKFSVSLAPDTWHPLKGDGVEFIVLARENGTSTYDILYDKYIDPKNNVDDRRLFHEQINLTRYWDKNTEIVLQTKSGPNNNSMYDTAGWGNPRIIMQ